MEDLGCLPQAARRRADAATSQREGNGRTPPPLRGAYRLGYGPSPSPWRHSMRSAWAARRSASSTDSASADMHGKTIPSMTSFPVSACGPFLSALGHITTSFPHQESKSWAIMTCPESTVRSRMRKHQTPRSSDVTRRHRLLRPGFQHPNRSRFGSGRWETARSSGDETASQALPVPASRPKWSTCLIRLRSANASRREARPIPAARCVSFSD